jgi:Protein of unknown function (DUF2840)
MRHARCPQRGETTRRSAPRAERASRLARERDVDAVILPATSVLAESSREEETDVMPDDPFALITTVELTWIEKQVERWLRFGRPVADTILDRQRRVLSFASGSVFAFVRWAANEYGTVESHIDIVRTVGSGEDYQTVPCVRPGGEVLLHQTSWPRVQRVLEAIDAVEAQDIDPVEVSPDYWRHVHHRLEARQQPDAYTKARHRAWLRRRALH